MKGFYLDFYIFGMVNDENNTINSFGDINPQYLPSASTTIRSSIF